MLNSLIDSLLVIFGAAACSVGMALPCALAWSKFDPFLGRGAASLLFGFLLIPLYVQAAAWNAGLGPLGWWNSIRWFGLHRWFDGHLAVIWIHAVGLVPLMTIFIIIGLKRIPTTLEESAITEGGFRSLWFRAWWPTLWRWSCLAYLLGASIVGSDMLVTNLYRVPTLTERAYKQLVVGQLDLLAMSISCIPCLLVAILASAGFSKIRRGANREQNRTDAQAISTARKVGAGTFRLINRLMGLASWLIVAIVVFLPALNLMIKAGWTVEMVGETVEHRWRPSQWLESMLSVNEYREEFSWSAQLAIATASLSITLGWAIASVVTRYAWWSSATVGLAVGMLGVPGPVVNLLVKRSLESLPNRLSDLAIEESLLGPILALQFRCLPWSLVACIWMWDRWRKRHETLIQLESPKFLWVQSQMLRAHAGALTAVWMIAASIAIADLATYLLVMPAQVSTLASRIFELLHYGVRYKESGLCLTIMLVGATLGWFMANGRFWFYPESNDWTEPS